MENCGICYNDVKIIKLVKAGCCSMVICKDCIIKLDCCPQCKQNYFWSKEKPEVIKTIHQLQSEIINLIIDRDNAKNDINSLCTLVKKYQHKNELLSNEIETLKMANIQTIKDNIEQKQLEEVIKKYNLHIC